MPLVRITLETGFDGEAVVITLNGREIFRRDHVKTRADLGFASSVEERLAAGEAVIDVQAGSARKQFRVPLSEDLHLGVSLTGNKQIEHHKRAPDAGYA